MYWAASGPARSFRICEATDLTEGDFKTATSPDSEVSKAASPVIGGSPASSVGTPLRATRSVANSAGCALSSRPFSSSSSTAELVRIADRSLRKTAIRVDVSRCPDCKAESAARFLGAAGSRFTWSRSVSKLVSWLPYCASRVRENPATEGAMMALSRRPSAVRAPLDLASVTMRDDTRPDDPAIAGWAVTDKNAALKSSTAVMRQTAARQAEAERFTASSRIPPPVQQRPAPRLLRLAGASG